MRQLLQMGLRLAMLALAVAVASGQVSRGSDGQAATEPIEGPVTSVLGGPKLLFSKVVKDELKLSDGERAQVAKILDVEKKAADQAFEDAGGDFDKYRQASRAARNKAKDSLEKLVADLKPEQAKRYRQINVQLVGIGAFAYQAVRKPLKLTDAQMEAILAEQRAMDKDCLKLSEDVPPGDAAKAKEIAKKRDQRKQAALDKAVGMLTEEQRKAWNELTGTKFDANRLDLPADWR